MIRAPLICLLACLVLSGCNTFRGVGKDMESFGSGMAQTASQSRQQINQWEEEMFGEEASPTQAVRQENHSDSHIHDDHDMIEHDSFHDNSASMRFSSPDYQTEDRYY